LKNKIYTDEIEHDPDSHRGYIHWDAPIAPIAIGGEIMRDSI